MWSFCSHHVIFIKIKELMLVMFLLQLISLLSISILFYTSLWAINVNINFIDICIRYSANSTVLIQPQERFSVPVFEKAKHLFCTSIWKSKTFFSCDLAFKKIPVLLFGITEKVEIAMKNVFIFLCLMFFLFYDTPCNTTQHIESKLTHRIVSRITKVNRDAMKQKNTRTR